MMVAWLGDDHNAGMTHAQVEERLHTDGLALLRQLFQDSLDLRASREPRLHEVCDADGVERGTAEEGRERALATRFGQVTVARIAYRGRGLGDLHPADAVLNLPAEKHSHGYASWRRSRPPAARSPTRRRRSDGRLGPGRQTPGRGVDRAGRGRRCRLLHRTGTRAWAGHRCAGDAV